MIVNFRERMRELGAKIHSRGLDQMMPWNKENCNEYSSKEHKGEIVEVVNWIGTCTWGCEIVVPSPEIFTRDDKCSKAYLKSKSQANVGRVVFETFQEKHHSQSTGKISCAVLGQSLQL